MGLYRTMSTLTSCIIENEKYSNIQSHNSYNSPQTTDAVLREIVASRRRYAEAKRMTSAINKEPEKQKDN